MKRPDVPQSGVFPYRWRDNVLEILLITSRRTGQWGIPKGKLEPGLTPAESAAEEAWEEAGASGLITPEVVGHYSYTKHNRRYRVEVYPFQVQQLQPSWLEQHQRQRRWFALDDALAAITNQELRELLQRWAAGLTPE